VPRDAHAGRQSKPDRNRLRLAHRVGKRLRVGQSARVASGAGTTSDLASLVLIVVMRAPGPPARAFTQRGRRGGSACATWGWEICRTRPAEPPATRAAARFCAHRARPLGSDRDISTAT